MLHRAARNAYSWWWASHIRTKQSKWLEQNLQDMEEKVDYILEIINEDGDSFTVKAEMFFRRRPELVNFIEDCFKGYRALADRYDKLSKDMQNANRTIATVFPEKVQYTMDDDFEDFTPVSSQSRESANPPKSPPPPTYISPKKSPSFSSKSMKSPTRLMSKRGLLKLGSINDADIAAAAAAKKSGLSKSEALVEIDRLQKGILALQTEKEFIKSSYENGLAKCLDIEKQVTHMQAKVSSLQDEFGIEKAFEDDEARTLMAATALNSCQEKLTTLQGKHEHSIKEAKAGSKNIEAVREKFETLIEQLKNENSEGNESVRETMKLDKLDQQNRSMDDERNNVGLVKLNLKEQLQVNGESSLTVSELAEKIDELVDTVLNLESSVSSQSASVKRLTLEINELEEKLQSLEEDKESLTDSSHSKSNKIRELEDELHILQSFKQSISNQNKNSQKSFKAGSCNIDNSVTNIQNLESLQPGREVSGVNYMASPEKCYMRDSRANEKLKEDGNHGNKSMAGEPELSEQRYNHSIRDPAKDATGEHFGRGTKREDTMPRSHEPVISSHTDVDRKRNKDAVKGFKDDTNLMAFSDNSLISKEIKKNDNQKKSSLGHVSTGKGEERKMQDDDKKQLLSQISEMDEQEFSSDKGQPNWREIFLNDLEDRERLLLEEYNSLLQSFKRLKKKLSDAEKKHRTSLFKSTVQIKVLKNASDSKDAEIQSLHKKLKLLQKTEDVSNTNKSIPPNNSQVSDTSSPNLDRKEAPHILEEHQVETTENATESTAAEQMNFPDEYYAGELKLPPAISSIEEKIRMDLDELLEENIEFWLRYSTSFHQVQKFQTTFHDLQAELADLKESKKHEGPLQQSDVRPIYMHLRDIKTELTLWLQQNEVLEDDLQNRLSSISSIQEEISRLSCAGSDVAEETELTDHQAAKFTGEIMNMKQENNKVADELLIGIERVKKLKVEIETEVAKLDEEFGFSATRNHHSRHSKHKIPLRSFLFGVKLKKQKRSLLSCISPSVQIEQIDVCELRQPHNR